MVENALLAKVTEKNAKWGCCILMETQTGYIRAVANLDRGEDGKYYEAQNHAVQRVEPGSTFKTIALLAALDDGKIDIDKLEPIIFDSSMLCYRKIGESIGPAWGIGKKFM